MQLQLPLICSYSFHSYSKEFIMKDRTNIIYIVCRHLGQMLGCYNRGF